MTQATFKRRRNQSDCAESPTGGHKARTSAAEMHSYGGLSRRDVLDTSLLRRLATLLTEADRPSLDLRG